MTALSNAYAKEISALKLKKYRQSYRKFIIEGPNLIKEALQQDRYEIESIVGTNDFLNAMDVEIPSHINVIQVLERELKKVSTLKTTYGGLAVLNMDANSPGLTEPLSFYLDGIQDPGNLGTIIRAADWFGIQQLLLGSGTVDAFNPKTLRATMGSIFRVECLESSIEQLEILKQDYRIVGTSTRGTLLNKYSPAEKTIIVIGNEGRGMSDKTEALTDEDLTIASYGKSDTESLNAAMSAAIIMYDLQTKRADH